MIIIQTFRESEKVYRACIAGGWWMAVGKTKAKAIKKAIKARKKELEYFHHSTKFNRTASNTAGTTPAAPPATPLAGRQRVRQQKEPL